MAPTPDETPRTLPGPVVNDQATVVTISSKAHFLTSPQLPALLTTVNAAFRAAHAAQPALGMSVGDRIGSPAEFFLNISDDPRTFILVLTPAGRPEHVLATATCRRYLGPPARGDAAAWASPWARKSPAEAGVDAWELKLLAVDPAVQRQGVAQFVMTVVEEEAMRRSVSEAAGQGDPGQRRRTTVKMVLTTPKEINERFYAKRGFGADYEVERGEGMNFHIIFMSKVLGEVG